MIDRARKQPKSRRIIVTLPADVTGHGCGSCPLLYYLRGDALAPEPLQWRCRIYGPIVSPPGDGQFRAAACIDAEKAKA